MMIRLRGVARIGRDTFRLALDLIDADRPDWRTGDCVVQVDVRDAPKHEAVPRGPVAAALELYRLTPDRRPDAADARLLWDMGQVVDAYVTRLFEAGVLCPFTPAAKDEPSEAPRE
ncbi:MAG: hypothetical protein HY359_03855 [Candidatus Rokubacteria bacterium]|nr:hypothetical protein [Candidatus Rokubacteria bacterium]